MAPRIDKNARPLIGLAILLVVLAALMIGTKSHAPKLGLDLRGGTTITLTARNTTGDGRVAQTSLDQARQIIQNRVDSLGVGESDVTTNNQDQITVTVPNVNADALVKLVGQTAQLEFRNVYQAEQQAPAPSASASAQPSVNPTDAPTGAGQTAEPQSPGASGSASTSPSSTPSPTSTRPSAYPSAPPPPVPSAGATPTTPGTPPDKAMQWQPTDADLQAFSTYQCGNPVTDVSDQPLITCDVDKTEKFLLGPTILPGRQVTNATAGIPQNGVSWAVDLSFDADGAKTFGEVTSSLAGQQPPMNRFGIALDGVIQSAPQVNDPILDGRAQITGNFTATSAQQLANVLKYGALPLAFDVSSVDNVSAVLGGEQLRAGIIAGIIGLILVVAFSFAYYRGLGIVVVSSLIVAAALTYAAMSLLGQSVGFALNLPGIAGAIVAIGITADSFIIYFERIRDEVRDGRSLRSAITSGWRRARRTVLIADSVSLLSAVVLFILAIGSVRGFAFTLGLTTVIDIAVVFWFTRPFLSLLARTKFFGHGHKLSGLDPAHLGVSALPGRARTARGEA